MISKTFRVVVVDDEKLIARNIAKNISSCDAAFEVVAICFDGLSALDAIKEHAPHVLFTDIKMPLMDGLSLIENVHGFNPAIRCVLISGYNEFEYAKSAIQFKAFDYLLKPLNRFELSKTLRKLKDELLSEHALLNSDREKATDDIVQSIIRYLQTNYSKDINFSQIALDYNFSSSYLTKIFKEHVGISPIKYLIEYRIEIAKGLLLDTTMTVKEIADKTGFQDQFYFSKSFKNSCGVTPSLFRNDHIK